MEDFQKNVSRPEEWGAANIERAIAHYQKILGPECNVLSVSKIYASTWLWIKEHYEDELCEDMKIPEICPPIAIDWNDSFKSQATHSVRSYSTEGKSPKIFIPYSYNITFYPKVTLTQSMDFFDGMCPASCIELQFVHTSIHELCHHFRFYRAMTSPGDAYSDHMRVPEKEEELETELVAVQLFEEYVREFWGNGTFSAFAPVHGSRYDRYLRSRDSDWKLGSSTFELIESRVDRTFKFHGKICSRTEWEEEIDRRNIMDFWKKSPEGSGERNWVVIN